MRISVSFPHVCYLLIGAICVGTGCSEPEDAGPASCSATGESTRVGTAGAVFDPLMELFATEERALVAWKQLGGELHGALWVAAAAAGKPAPGSPTLLAAASPGRSQPVLLSSADTVLAAWHQSTGPAETDAEVRYQQIDGSGQLSGAETVLHTGREGLNWAASPRNLDTPWLWTMAIDDDAFRLTDLARPQDPPIEWNVGSALDDTRNLRMVRLADGEFAVVYEKRAGGVFFERLGASPTAISGAGTRLGTAPGLERRPVRSEDLLVIGREDLIEDEGGGADRSVIGFILFDDQGNMLAEPIAAERVLDGSSSLHYVATWFVRDEIRVYWVERAPDANIPDHNVLTLYHARYARDGTPIGGAELLQKLANHPDLFEYDEVLDSGTEVFVAPVGNHLAISYSVGFYEPLAEGPDQFAFAGSDLFLAWRCLD